MKRRMLFIAVLALTLGACAGADTSPSAGGPTESPSPSPAPAPTQTTYQEPEWSITVPAGWISQDWTGTADSKKSVRYLAGDGSYFIVAIDPLGSDYGYDALWRYDVKGRGFTVIEKYECAGTSDEPCRDDDNRYDGFVFAREGTQPKVSGHSWYFIFGNEKSKFADLSQAEAILKSIVVK